MRTWITFRVLFPHCAKLSEVLLSFKKDGIPKCTDVSFWDFSGRNSHWCQAKTKSEKIEVYVYVYMYMTQLLLLGKFEYDGGPIFKVVLEC